jgi:hypothetical protein
MEVSLHIKDLKSKFSEYFRNYELEYEPVNFELGNIHSFFILFSATNELENNWREISNFIALHFQSKLENKFEIWNIYLFFKMPAKVESPLKYLIENDTFSSRKIIIEAEASNEAIINEHIMNTDLLFGERNTDENIFQKNTTIWEALKDKPNTKKVSPSDMEAFENISNLIKLSKNEN